MKTEKNDHTHLLRSANNESECGKLRLRIACPKKYATFFFFRYAAFVGLCASANLNVITLHVCLPLLCGQSDSPPSPPPPCTAQLSYPPSFCNCKGVESDCFFFLRPYLPVFHQLKQDTWNTHTRTLTPAHAWHTFQRFQCIWLWFPFGLHTFPPIWLMLLLHVQLTAAWVQLCVCVSQSVCVSGFQRQNFVKWVSMSSVLLNSPLRDCLPKLKQHSEQQMTQLQLNERATRQMCINCHAPSTESLSRLSTDRESAACSG